MPPNALRRTLALAVVGSLCVACGSQPPTSPPSGVDELVIPTPTPDPHDFVDRIDNPWLPLAPGNEWVYTSTTDDGDETITTSVLDRPKVVAGVTTTVVHDVTTDHEERVIRDTFEWYAQDQAGNVWYFGERTATYDRNGHVESREGSWKAGVDGAVRGLIMPANPRPTDAYRQEFYKGHAEDQAWIVQANTRVRVPYGTLDHVVRGFEWTRLEKGVLAVKFYAPGLGIVREKDLSGGDELFELVSVRHR